MSSASFPANKKPHERGHAVWYYQPVLPKKRARQTLALASFHARVLFVNNIETAATTNHLTVTIA
jgi:hypothetical protein